MTAQGMSAGTAKTPKAVEGEARQPGSRSECAQRRSRMTTPLSTHTSSEGRALHFRCGHPRTPENTAPHGARRVCRACQRAWRQDYHKGTDAQASHIEHRQRYLPIALERTRAKLAALENEARRYGMVELLTDLSHADREWDKTVQRARAAAESVGGSIGFGDGKR